MAILVAAATACADPGPGGAAAAPSTTSSPLAEGAGNADADAGARPRGELSPPPLKNYQRGSPSTRAATASAPPSAPSGTQYRFPIRGCSSTYGRTHHDYPATDIFAAAGCSVVAPVSGRVDEVTYTDHWNASTNVGARRGGISVSVIGVDGVRYYGSHLQGVTPGVRPGLEVSVGQSLGRVGNTGSARGTPPHLHFGISWPTAPGTWWIRRGMVYPWPYLDSWRSGGKRSPVAAVATLRTRLGETPPCQAHC